MKQRIFILKWPISRRKSVKTDFCWRKFLPWCFGIDFIGDEAEKIFYYDVPGQKLIRQLRSVSVFPNINPWEIKETDSTKLTGKTISFIDLLKKNIQEFSVVLCDPAEIYLKIRSDIDILKRVFDRDKDSLVTDGKIIIDFYFYLGYFFYLK